MLFFGTASPEVIARRNLSSRNPKPEQIQQWIKDHGYDKSPAEQLKVSTIDMMLFKFGKSDSTKEDIWERIKEGTGPSFVVGTTIFVSTLIGSLLFAIIAAYFRGTYIDAITTFLCVLMLSIVYMLYIMGFPTGHGKTA